MSSLFSWREVVSLLGGDLLGSSVGDISRVVLDSRDVDDRSLFVPLIGEVQDGNKFIPSAVENGAKYALVTRSYYIDNGSVLTELVEARGVSLCIVENTLVALQLLAREYIQKFPGLRVIAITGSSGKTSTKEILGSIVGCYKDTLVTKGNYNSETGLPLTVFRINGEHKFAVLEIGMSKPGEIKALVDIIHPEVSIITNIGTAHIGFFGSKDGIAKEKKDAFANFIGNNMGIIPDWDDFADYLSKGVNGDVVRVLENPPYISDLVDRGFEGWEFRYEQSVVKFPYIGRYNLLNAYMAIECSRRIGIPGEFIVKGLERIKPIFGRGEILNGKNRVIRDCYNANPASTLSSLELLNTTRWSGDKVAILGSMLELGDLSYKEHMAIANKAVSYGFDKIILFGKEYSSVFNNFKELDNFYYCKDMKALRSFVDKHIGEGSLILLKASRGEKLEDITENIL